MDAGDGTTATTGARARALLVAAFTELLGPTAAREAAGWTDRIAGTPSGRLLLERADAAPRHGSTAARGMRCRKCRTAIVCLEPDAFDGRLVHANGDRSHAARPMECARILGHGMRCGSTEDSGRHGGGRWPGHGFWCCDSAPHAPIDDCHAFEDPPAA